MSKEAQLHTDYCRSKGINKESLVTSWKRLSPAGNNSNPFELAASSKKRKHPSETACR